MEIRKTEHLSEQKRKAEKESFATQKKTEEAKIKEDFSTVFASEGKKSGVRKCRYMPKECNACLSVSPDFYIG